MSQNEHNLTSNSTGIATSLFNIIRTSHEGLDDSDRPLLSDYLILHLSISDRLLKGRISNYYNKRLTLFPDISIFHGQSPIATLAHKDHKHFVL